MILIILALLSNANIRFWGLIVQALTDMTGGVKQGQKYTDIILRYPLLLYDQAMA